MDHILAIAKLDTIEKKASASVNVSVTQNNFKNKCNLLKNVHFPQIISLQLVKQGLMESTAARNATVFHKTVLM